MRYGASILLLPLVLLAACGGGGSDEAQTQAAAQRQAAARKYQQAVYPSLLRLERALDSAVGAVDGFESGQASIGETQDAVLAAQEDLQGITDNLLDAVPPARFEADHRQLLDVLGTLDQALGEYGAYVEAYLDCNSNLSTYVDSADIDRDIYGSVQRDTKRYLKDAKDAADRSATSAASYNETVAAFEADARALAAGLERKGVRPLPDIGVDFPDGPLSVYVEGEDCFTGDF